MADSKRVGLDNLSPPDGSRSSKRRRGRGHGSGAGKTSGRGHKGQKARSGAKIPPWFEGGQMPLYRRTPKRGFNPYRRQTWSIVNLGDLERVGDREIDPEALYLHGLISTLDHPVKILARGDAPDGLTVRAHAFSASAREKIEAAGGTVQVLE